MQPGQLAGALRHDRSRDPRRRPTAPSRTSSPASAPAARSWAPAADLREHKPTVPLISVQPESPLHGLEGLKHMESAIVPAIYDRGAGRRSICASAPRTPTSSRVVWRTEEGLLVGISSGAALSASLRRSRGTIERRRAS